jgi:hypothetical protein
MNTLILPLRSSNSLVERKIRVFVPPEHGGGFAPPTGGHAKIGTRFAPRAVAEVKALWLLWQAAHNPRYLALWLGLRPGG